jgi:D-tyrosyl-tRNA(Tyr) deacylase
MRAVVQRVTRAEVRIEGVAVGAIGAGLAILLGVGRDDGEGEADRLAARLARLRIFPDPAGRFDRSLLDTGGSALVVSQFTLYGDSARGNRPSFSEAADPELAEPLYERVCERLAAEGVGSVERGRFGAHMQVELVNDGPVTIVVELAGDPARRVRPASA